MYIVLAHCLCTALVLYNSFSCYMVYIWSRVYEGQQVDVMGMFMLQAELLPFFFILQVRERLLLHANRSVL
jgi:hypothetical protein